ncbi:methionine aminopeptidase [Anopheles sinensis]|uniref:Methionine aminopeptidase n=1 Tax=Anopheles sinensis TaxID=74873 RepID=A0A084VTN9_ANOSI|nr:methionine aminopeptidase [Anopheles sinensis]
MPYGTSLHAKAKRSATVCVISGAKRIAVWLRVRDPHGKCGDRRNRNAQPGRREHGGHNGPGSESTSQPSLPDT